MRNLHLKMIGSLKVNKMTKLKTDIEKNTDTTMKTTESIMYYLAQGLLIAMRNTRAGNKAQREIKKEKRIAKKIVNHVQILKKRKNPVITRTVIGLEGIAAHTTPQKLS